MVTSSPTAQAHTPMAFIQAMVEAYRRRGMDPSGALAKAQIAPNLLNQSQARVTALQMEWMSEAAMRELDDEALGWFSRRLPWGSYGMLVRASLTSPTLAVALQRWCRHHGLLTQDIVVTLDTHDGLARLTLTEHRDLDELREFCVVSVLRNALGVACWLTDSRIALRGTTLRFAPPPHAASYGVLFEGPTTFNAAANSLSGGAGDDTLEGGAGADTLSGGELQRVRLAMAAEQLPEGELTSIVTDALQALPEGRRHALAEWLFESDATRRLSVVAADDAARAYRELACLQEVHEQVTPNGHRHRLWKRIQERLGLLEPESPTSDRIANLLTSLFSDKRIDEEDEIDRILDGFFHTRAQLAGEAA